MLAESLTKVGNPVEARVKANLQHLLCMCQEEVDHAISDYTIRETFNDVVIALTDSQAISSLTTRLHADLFSVGGEVACNLPYCSTHLQKTNNNVEDGWCGLLCVCEGDSICRKKWFLKGDYFIILILVILF